MLETGTAIVGAGVVGLAVAAELSARGEECVVVEQHDSFGREASSRSSEVIHAGLFYKPGSLRARLCVEGKRLLYEYCAAEAIPHDRLGKVVVATEAGDEAHLEHLFEQGRANGVDDLRRLAHAEAAALGPVVRAVAGFASPSSGIVDSHALMRSLERRATERGAIFAYGTRLAAVERTGSAYRLELREAGRGPAGDGAGSDRSAREKLLAHAVVNCAGLEADTVAALAGIDVAAAGYTLVYTRGEFFNVASRCRLPASPLVYRARPDNAVGIHTVVDLQGRVKLGPFIYPADRRIAYSMENSRLADALAESVALFPALTADDVTPDMVGLSPRRQPRADWVVREESDRGLPGFVNLIGMDSPALTSCLAIGREVARLLGR